MPTRVGSLRGNPLEVRLLDQYVNYPPFVDFCCGKDSMPAHEVNRTVRRLYSDEVTMPQVPAILESVTEDDFNGCRPLLAVCSLSTAFPIPGLGGRPHGYIVAFGTDLDNQREKLDGQMSCGGGVLCGAFAELQTRLAVPRVPYVWATVKPDNGPSSRRLDRHGFDLVGEQPGVNVVMRVPGLDPFFTRDCGWSLAI
jgi:hypothetical protein